MLKFTMNVKELKTMIDKGVAAINKKSTFPELTKLYFQVEEDGTLKILGTDFEHYVELRSDNVWNARPGVFGIDIDDLKIITKMGTEITLEDISSSEDLKINVQSGKKNITIPKYTNTDIFLPAMDETEKCILSVNESWLLETVINLSVFTSDNGNDKMMQFLNFNTVRRRVEALDRSRIGMRTLENHTIKNKSENVLLHNKCLPILKKIIDKKSDSEVAIYQDKKYIKIEGKDYTYYTKRVDGVYFKIDQLLRNDFDYSFSVDKEEMFSVMKYNCDLVKNERKPVVLHSENGVLYTYLKTAKYEAVDIVETKDNTMEDDFYIGFNPNYFSDIFGMVDTDYPICKGKSNKSPLFVYGNEYSFIVLPINIQDKKDSMKNV